VNGVGWLPVSVNSACAATKLDTNHDLTGRLPVTWWYSCCKLVLRAEFVQAHLHAGTEMLVDMAVQQPVARVVGDELSGVGSAAEHSIDQPASQDRKQTFVVWRVPM
jgi:hypothetical protein